MLNYNIVEFAKIYKRYIAIEGELKSRFICAMTNSVGAKAFYRLIPFLNSKNFNKAKYNTKYDNSNKIDRIINSNKSDNDKLPDLVHKIYIADLLDILTKHQLIYQNPSFVAQFYCKRPNFNDLKKYSECLKLLRNNLMHFNYGDYVKNKVKYLESLYFWEVTLSCNHSYIHSWRRIKPTIKGILSLIKENNRDIFKQNDRVICDLFDDLAFLNGGKVQDLPQYWSICRQIYEIRAEIKKTQDVHDLSEISF